MDLALWLVRQASPELAAVTARYLIVDPRLVEDVGQPQVDRGDQVVEPLAGQRGHRLHVGPARVGAAQRRAQVGLNKGEAHHALKNALRIGRQGEIRDRTTEGQHYRIAGLNLLTAIIVYWNTLHLGHAVEARRREGLETPDHLLAHVSPLGWAHILLTGEYLWPKDADA